ncbi:hypothetical protein J8N05_18480 [Streptomyces sp. BH-SS-21]|uniref:Uncharacterized protein n=1 Tax=Streptomyces liliiviolaceus TaxID=2823109 RepID=A0A940XT94_9ACTN|nr:hypothetical protein [Streptomyces liliiviolaceus]MBQ0850187.1 hypothetical protein [Streptomyces liliiviolaceus]
MAEQETRQMLPEVQKYLASIEAATAARQEALREVHAKYAGRYVDTKDGQLQLAAYNQASNTAYDACEEARTAAWEALTTSDDPLVKWIAKNCANYRSEAQHVLTALPATVEELDAVAASNDWCPVWAEFRQQAMDAEVIPDPNRLIAAREALFECIDREGCCPMRATSRSRIDTALDALIEESVRAAASATGRMSPQPA